MLGMAAAGAATTTVALAGPGLSAAAGAAAPPRAAVGSQRSAGFLAVPARVTAVSGSTIDAEALDPEEEPEEPWAAVPVALFPWDLVPRVGDHVTVTDAVDGLPLAAVPLCAWVDGTPTASASGGYVVAGRATVPANRIAAEPAGVLAAAEGARAITVCLADTELEEALVFQARTALTATQPATP
jgi:hypothetical protein